MKIKELLTSRKFWAMVTVVLGLVGSMLEGAVTPQVGIGGIVAAIITWYNAQSRVDAARVGRG